ncbi:MAG: DUF499 domain-containing protein [Cyanobacteria bacterium MAG IRC1_bin_28]|nr:DUF499 domain-containing protein [Cyanobacteria bacterium MAG IRC3_bin_20]MCY3654008.1 DUF499 domain-containing protein [Cyanobacteria bacterium MAG IRC1_bin_28]MDE0647113.1 DUF499 domain-containing protein [Cyanobacteria bacterium MAG IRC4_bin_6]
MAIRPPVGQNDDRAEALRKGYPLHPELIETLMQKTSTLENFQQVRGMLRLLARTVAQLWREQPGDATAIHLHHVDPGNERIRLEVATKLGRQAFIPGSGLTWPAPAPRTAKPWPNNWIRANLRAWRPTAP